MRHPWQAFKEVLRVLKSGGYHIFTIPVQDPVRHKTVYRVDTSGDRDIHLMEERYHIAGDGDKSLVYTEFGKDIVARLEAIGFEIELLKLKNTDSELQKIVTFVTRKV